MKKEYLIEAGLIGAAIGFAIGVRATLKKCKDTIDKDVKEAVNKEIKDNVMKDLDVKELRKEVKEEAVNKVADKIDKHTNEKLKDFDERLKVMEDIDAKKLDLAKAAITAGVTISTVLIKAIYDNKNNNDIRLEKYIDALGDKHNELTNVCLENFAEAERRLSALEVK